MIASSNPPLSVPQLELTATARAVRDVPLPHVARGPLVVATDGSGPATAALVVARLLAAAPGDVHVVSVLEPMPVLMPPAEVPIYSVEADEARAQAHHERLQWQVDGIFTDGKPTLDVLIGSPIERLAHVARERRARMVITGLRHHGRLDRMMLHRETPLGIAEASRTPVLIVPQGTTRLPRVAVVAADVDEASVNAARRARPLLADAEKVYVVHVRGRVQVAAGDATAEWERVVEAQTQSAFERVIAALDLSPDVRTETRTVTGHPVDELLDFADFVHADLIVAGHHKRRLADRITGPHSVAERVFRGASCAMLLVPDVPGVELPFGMRADTEVAARRADWPLQVAAFTYRNAGRTGHLEIDATGAGGTGVQAQVDGLPFLAVEYDEATDRLRLTFGARDGAGPRLVYSMPRASAIEVQRRREGKDLALRVAHEDGYSLLTFRPVDGAGGGTA